MNIKDLKAWLTTLPLEVDENELVFRTFIAEDDDCYIVRDAPITACGIDDGNKEAYFSSIDDDQSSSLN